MLAITVRIMYLDVVGMKTRAYGNHWWNAFVKAWAKIGNAYKNNNAPPVNMLGCERFVRRCDQEIVVKTPSAPPPPLPPALPTPAVDVVAVISSCASKARYSSIEVADAVAVRCSAERGVALRSYVCDLCGGVHLTRRGVSQVKNEKPGWREPKISERLLNIARKNRRSTSKAR